MTQIAEKMRELARIYGGSVSTLSSWPVLSIRREGFEAIFDCTPPRGLYFAAQPDGKYQGSLHLSPEGFSSSLSKLMGEREIDVGDPEFDSLYFIRSRNADFARTALGPEIRALIRTLGRRGSVTLTINPRMFQIRFGVFDLTADTLDTCLSCALQIADCLKRLMTPEAVVLIDTKVLMAETACQVCGTPLEGKLVECVKCSTLHHADCWTFNGRCSTFACGSLASRKAVVKGSDGR